MTDIRHDTDARCFRTSFDGSDAAFEYAREAGLHVRPLCSYAAGWAERHPEYRPLLD
jgi:hypothetical protein